MADDHQAVGDHSLVRAVFPGRLYPASLDQQLHVAFVRQDRHVGVKARSDRPGLGSGAVVRLFERDGPAGLALPFGFERRQQTVVQDLANDRVSPDLEHVGVGITRGITSRTQPGNKTTAAQSIDATRPGISATPQQTQARSGPVRLWRVTTQRSGQNFLATPARHSPAATDRTHTTNNVDRESDRRPSCLPNSTYVVKIIL